MKSFHLTLRKLLLIAVSILGWSVDSPGQTLDWSTSGYTAGNVNGSVASTDEAMTTSSVVFDVTNTPFPGLGFFIAGAPAVTDDDFAAQGLYIDYAYTGSSNVAVTELDPDLFLQGVNFVIGDLDSDNSSAKQDGVVVSGINMAGATVYPTITLAPTTQLIISGVPGEVYSSIAPNRGQDDTRAQATFDFGSEFLDSIRIEYFNYGTATNDDNHWGVSDISWTAEAVPEPSSALLLLAGAFLFLFARPRRVREGLRG